MFCCATIERTYQNSGEYSEVLRVTDADGRIDYDFAIATKEVTVEEFRRFRAEHEFSKSIVQSDQCPVNKVSWFHAAEYCNWLSAQAGLPPKGLVLHDARSDPAEAMGDGQGATR